jgi:hypothetical protein
MKLHKTCLHAQSSWIGQVIRTWIDPCSCSARSIVVSSLALVLVA